MGKKGTLYIVLAVISLGALMLLQYNKPKKLNWFESYVASHKIPYGTYVFNQLISNFFNKQVEQINIPPFEFLQNNDKVSGAYFFVDKDITFQQAELESLLEWTSKGNTLFIASKGFEKSLLDTLQLKIGNLYSGFEPNQIQNLKLVNPNLNIKDSITFDKGAYSPYFNKIDTLNTIVVGKVEVKGSENKDLSPVHINIIKQNFGDGKIILSTFPEAFTNYFLLKENNTDYTAALVSYLNDSPTIYIDNYYRSGKSFYTSPMYIFLNTIELKWAYYTALIGALIYIVFEGKRKQRAIPVVVPLKNQTLAFTRTIADMYFEKGEAKAISDHKINYFLDEIRSTYFIPTIRYKDDFYKSLAGKSGQSFEAVKTVFTYIKHLQNRSQVTDTELIELNTLIQKFKADGK